MQRAKEDLAQAMGSKMNLSDKSILEILGYDTDSSFKEPQQVMISQSVQEISIGGQDNIKSGNLQVAIRDEGVLLDINKSCVAFDLTLGTTTILPDNICQAFQPINCQLGKLSWAVGDGQRCLQSYIHTKPKKFYKKIANGLLMSTTRRVTPYRYSATEGEAVASGTGPIGFEETKAAGRVGQSNLITQEIYIEKLIRDKLIAVNKLPDDFADVAFRGGSVVRCLIPLSLLWPWLGETFQDGVVFLGMGQSLVMNAQIMDKIYWLNQEFKGLSATYDFKISGATLVKVYSQLDPERLSLVLKSSLYYQKIEYLMVKQPLGASVVLNYNISDKQRVKRLFITHFYRNTVVLPLADTNIVRESNDDDKLFLADTAEANKLSSYKNPSGYFPALHKLIKLLTINFGGATRTYNCQQLSLLGTSGIISQADSPYEDSSLQYYMKSVFVLDFSRMCADLVGSSTGNQLAMQIQITYQRGEFVINGVTCELNAPFDVQTYLETGSAMSLENGIYKQL